MLIHLSRRIHAVMSLTSLQRCFWSNPSEITVVITPYTIVLVCKDDLQSIWKKANFDLQPTQNP